MTDFYFLKLRADVVHHIISDFSVFVDFWFSNPKDDRSTSKESWSVMEKIGQEDEMGNDGDKAFVRETTSGRA